MRDDHRKGNPTSLRDTTPNTVTKTSQEMREEKVPVQRSVGVPPLRPTKGDEDAAPPGKWCRAILHRSGRRHARGLCARGVDGPPLLGAAAPSRGCVLPLHRL